MGQGLADLVYVKRVEFGPEAYERAAGGTEGEGAAAARP